MTKALSLPILNPPRAVSPCPAILSEPQLFLDRLDPIEQFAQPMNPGDLPLRLWQRHSWRAKPCAARQVLRNAALRRDNRVVLDGKMANYPDLAGNHYFFSDAGAAGNARLRGDDGMFSNNDVVLDLHKIVDLNAFLDPGPAESSALNGCVCPDLNVAGKLDNSELRNYLV